MSLWRNGEANKDEVQNPENVRKNSEVDSKPISEDDKKKLTPSQQFRDKYHVPDEKLNKNEGQKNIKLNESDDRPGQSGGNGRERGFEFER